MRIVIIATCVGFKGIWVSVIGGGLRRADGTVDVFNDLPPAWRGNVNCSEAPYNRQRGDAPALSDAEIDEPIAFLATLSDGYTP